MLQCWQIIPYFNKKTSCSGLGPKEPFDLIAGVKTQSAAPNDIYSHSYTAHKEQDGHRCRLAFSLEHPSLAVTVRGFIQCLNMLVRSVARGRGRIDACMCSKCSVFNDHSCKRNYLFVVNCLSPTIWMQPLRPTTSLNKCRYTFSTVFPRVRWVNPLRGSCVFFGWAWPQGGAPLCVMKAGVLSGAVKRWTYTVNTNYCVGARAQQRRCVSRWRRARARWTWWGRRRQHCGGLSPRWWGHWFSGCPPLVREHLSSPPCDLWPAAAPRLRLQTQLQGNRGRLDINFPVLWTEVLKPRVMPFGRRHLIICHQKWHREGGAYKYDKTLSIKNTFLNVTINCP